MLKRGPNNTTHKVTRPTQVEIINHTETMKSAQSVICSTVVMMIKDYITKHSNHWPNSNID